MPPEKKPDETDLKANNTGEPENTSSNLGNPNNPATVLSDSPVEGTTDAGFKDTGSINRDRDPANLGDAGPGNSDVREGVDTRPPLSRQEVAESTDNDDILTGRKLDEQLGTNFSNREDARNSPVAGTAVGLNNKDLIDPTADNRRGDDDGARPPVHRYDENSVDGPEDNRFTSPIHVDPGPAEHGQVDPAVHEKNPDPAHKDRVEGSAPLHN